MLNPSAIAEHDIRTVSPRSCWQAQSPTLMLIGHHLTAEHVAQVEQHYAGSLTLVVAEPLTDTLSRFGWQGDDSAMLRTLPVLAAKSELQWLPANLPSLSAPGLLLMDMDSTAITIECIDEIARAGGVYQQVAAVTAEAMAGGLDFAQSLRRRVNMLNGIPTETLTALAAEPPLMPGLLILCQRLKAAGWRVGLASGGFTPMAQAVAQLADMDYFEANDLLSANGKFNGELGEQIVDAQRKAQILRQLGAQWQISPTQWVAMGDGANDLPMLKQAALGIGVHAKPAVCAQADAVIQNLGLEAVLGLFYR